MPVEITTISVHPERAESLRRFRDEQGLSTMDAALEAALEEKES